jgi:alkylhydroperoxidase/carboxymuconolactone decarboxylase family protein YurZ
MTETERAARAEQLIASMRAGRGYIYPSHEYAARMDPEFLEAYNRLAALALLHDGVELEGRALAPKYRELVVIGVLAAKGGAGEGLVTHMRRALRLGASEAEILEALEATMIPAGAPAFLGGVAALARIHDQDSGAGGE